MWKHKSLISTIYIALAFNTIDTKETTNNPFHPKVLDANYIVNIKLKKQNGNLRDVQPVQKNVLQYRRLLNNAVLKNERILCPKILSSSDEYFVNRDGILHTYNDKLSKSKHPCVKKQKPVSRNPESNMDIDQAMSNNAQLYNGTSENTTESATGFVKRAQSISVDKEKLNNHIIESIDTFVVPRISRLIERNISNSIQKNVNSLEDDKYYIEITQAGTLFLKDNPEMLTKSTKKPNKTELKKQSELLNKYNFKYRAEAMNNHSKLTDSTDSNQEKPRLLQSNDCQQKINPTTLNPLTTTKSPEVYITTMKLLQNVVNDLDVDRANLTLQPINKNSVPYNSKISKLVLKQSDIDDTEARIISDKKIFPSKIIEYNESIPDIPLAQDEMKLGEKSHKSDANTVPTTTGSELKLTIKQVSLLQLRQVAAKSSLRGIQTLNKNVLPYYSENFVPYNSDVSNIELLKSDSPVTSQQKTVSISTDKYTMPDNKNNIGVTADKVKFEHEKSSSLNQSDTSLGKSLDTIKPPELQNVENLLKNLNVDRANLDETKSQDKNFVAQNSNVSNSVLGQSQAHRGTNKDDMNNTYQQETLPALNTKHDIPKNINNIGITVDKVKFDQENFRSIDKSEMPVVKVIISKKSPKLQILQVLNVDRANLNDTESLDKNFVLNDSHVLNFRLIKSNANDGTPKVKTRISSQQETNSVLSAKYSIPENRDNIRAAPSIVKLDPGKSLLKQSAISLERRINIIKPPEVQNVSNLLKNLNVDRINFDETQSLDKNLVPQNSSLLNSVLNARLANSIKNDQTKLPKTNRFGKIRSHQHKFKANKRLGHYLRNFQSFKSKPNIPKAKTTMIHNVQKAKKATASVKPNSKIVKRMQKGNHRRPFTKRVRSRKKQKSLSRNNKLSGKSGNKMKYSTFSKKMVLNHKKRRQPR